MTGRADPRSFDGGGPKCDLTIVLTTGRSSGRTSSSVPALARTHSLPTKHSEENAFQIEICL